MAKIVENIVVNRVTVEMEARTLIQNNQMGARQQRSTLSELELLTGTIKTVWAATKPVVSVLALDLAGAFDNVSDETLPWVLRCKGFPEWVVNYCTSSPSLRTGRSESASPANGSRLKPADPKDPRYHRSYSSSLQQTF